MESCVLRDAGRHFSSHAGSQLIHEGQKLVGRDLFHSHLGRKKGEKNSVMKMEHVDLLVNHMRMLTNLHYVVDIFNLSVFQPERSQTENPGVMLLPLFQTLNVILHRLA